MKIVWWNQSYRMLPIRWFVSASMYCSAANERIFIKSSMLTSNWPRQPHMPALIIMHRLFEDTEFISNLEDEMKQANVVQECNPFRLLRCLKHMGRNLELMTEFHPKPKKIPGQENLQTEAKMIYQEHNSTCDIYHKIVQARGRAGMQGK